MSETIDFKALAIQAMRDTAAKFKAEMLEKRTQFHERMHAAFILNTEVQFYLCPMPTIEDLEWLAHVYPASKIEEGNDQGARYMSIKPMLP